MFGILKLMWQILLSNWHHNRENYVKLAFRRSFWLFLWGVTRQLSTFIKYVVFPFLACLRHFLPSNLERRGLEIAKVKDFDISNLPDLNFKQLKYSFLVVMKLIKQFLKRIFINIASFNKALNSKTFDMHFSLVRARMASIFDDFVEKTKIVAGSYFSHCLL